MQRGKISSMGCFASFYCQSGYRAWCVLYGKLGVNSRTEAVEVATKEHII